VLLDERELGVVIQAAEGADEMLAGDASAEDNDFPT
jgi:hypothetical protein